MLNLSVAFCFDIVLAVWRYEHLKQSRVWVSKELEELPQNVDREYDKYHHSEDSIWSSNKYAQLTELLRIWAPHILHTYLIWPWVFANYFGQMKSYQFHSGIISFQPGNIYIRIPEPCKNQDLSGFMSSYLFALTDIFPLRIPMGFHHLLRRQA